MDILQFASDSPVLAFLLACLIVSIIYQAVRGIVHMVRGYPEGYKEDEFDEDDKE
jgi:hypothetical protein